MKHQQSNIIAIDIKAVKSRMLQVRGQQVLLALSVRRKENNGIMRLGEYRW